MHREYENHAGVFQNAFPKLKKLQIDDGHFSFATFGLFPPVETLKIKGTINPDPRDCLAEDQL